MVWSVSPTRHLDGRTSWGPIRVNGHRTVVRAIQSVALNDRDPRRARSASERATVERGSQNRPWTRPDREEGFGPFQEDKRRLSFPKKIIRIIITIMVILIRQRQADRVENLGQTKKKKTQRAKMGKIGNEKGKWKAKKKEKKRKRENLEIKTPLLRSGSHAEER